jgi:hypothetical protein
MRDDIEEICCGISDTASTKTTEQNKKKKKLNSVAVVRKRTIPTKRPPLVGEVSANSLRVEGVAWSAERIPTAVKLGLLERSR